MPDVAAFHPRLGRNRFVHQINLCRQIIEIGLAHNSLGDVVGLRFSFLVREVLGSPSNMGGLEGHGKRLLVVRYVSIGGAGLVVHYDAFSTSFCSAFSIFFSTSECISERTF